MIDTWSYDCFMDIGGAKVPAVQHCWNVNTNMDFENKFPIQGIIDTSIYQWVRFRWLHTTCRLRLEPTKKKDKNSEITHRCIMQFENLTTESPKPWPDSYFQSYSIFF